MTCCILEKQITTTVIPGSPGVPARPGSPARPGYCATSHVNVCEWIPNPSITYRYVFSCSPIPCGMKLKAFIGYVEVPSGSYQPFVYACHTNYVTTCYPAQAAVPGTPGTPPTPAQIVISKNLGWNSHSRSISPLEPDHILNFTVRSGVRGVFVGLAPAGVDGQRLRMFAHGLMIDVSGVHVYEHGVSVYELAVSHDGTTAFQIERRFDGTITYRADLSEYVSAVPAGDDVLYSYAYMYAGLDRIKCTSYTAMALVGTDMLVDAALTAPDATLGEAGVSYFFVDTSLGGVTSEMGVSEIEVITLESSLGALELTLGEAGVNFAFISADLPVLAAAHEEAEYVPPPLTEIYANLQPLAAGMFCTTVELCDVDATLPAIQAVIGEGNYTFMDAHVPGVVCYLNEGSRLDMQMVSSMLVSAPIDMVRDLVLTIMSTGELVSAQVMDLIMVQEYMSTLQAESIQSLLGTYGLEYLSDVSVQSVQLMTLPTGASLNNLGRVWVVNLDTNAASQYDGYAFNSFITRDGRQYGVADDGIYLLEGDDDAGDAIQAVAELGLSNLGDSRHKSVPSIYLGVASAGKMLVKVVADGAEYVYEARSSSTDLKNHRIDTGRGLKGTNWTFTVLNKNGCDFDLAEVEFLPLVTKRRI